MKETSFSFNYHGIFKIYLTTCLFRWKKKLPIKKIQSSLNPCTDWFIFCLEMNMTNKNIIFKWNTYFEPCTFKKCRAKSNEYVNECLRIFFYFIIYIIYVLL